MGEIKDTDLLRKEFIFWSRLGYGCDPARKDEDGSWHTAEPLNEHTTYHKDMSEQK